MNTDVPVPRDPVWTTSNPGTVRNASNTVTACWSWISLAVMTVADVVICSSGTSVRVEVTNIGGRVASGGCAAKTGIHPRENTMNKTAKTFMTISFSRERGAVEAEQIGLLARASNLLTAPSHQRCGSKVQEFNVQGRVP